MCAQKIIWCRPTEGNDDRPHPFHTGAPVGGVLFPPAAKKAKGGAGVGGIRRRRGRRRRGRGAATTANAARRPERRSAGSGEGRGAGKRDAGMMAGWVLFGQDRERESALSMSMVTRNDIS